MCKKMNLRSNLTIFARNSENGSRVLAAGQGTEISLQEILPELLLCELNEGKLMSSEKLVASLFGFLGRNFPIAFFFRSNQEN